MFLKGDLPDYRNFDHLKDGATKLIINRISSEIRIWSYRNNINDVPAYLFNQFIEDCKLMKGDVREIDQIFQRIRPPINHENLQNLGTNTPSPSLTVAETVVAVLSAPLWIPITVVSVPFVLIGISISEKIDFKQYKKNKKAFMGKLTKEVIEKYNEEVIYDGLIQQFVSDVMLNINQICENIIPKQIIADRKLIEKMAKQDSDSQTLKEEYIRIESKCKEIIRNLLYAKIKTFSDHPFRITNEGPILGTGSFAVVHLCDVYFGDKKIQCAVKRPTSSIQTDSYLQLSEAENIM